jgi:hypothetical protein
MGAWLACCVCYFTEVVRSLRPAFSWPALLVKLIGFLAGFALVFTLTNKVGIVVTSADGTRMWETDQPELRWVAFGLALLALVIWAMGAAWVRIFTFRVSDQVVRDFARYQIIISNLGYNETPVLVRMEEVADASGPRADWNAMFPITLFNSPISRGFPHVVPLLYCSVSTGSDGTQALFNVQDVVNPDRVARSLGYLNPNRKNKIWFRIAISQIERSMWFSVHFADTSSPTALAVVREDPPHVLKMSWWRRWFSVP